MSRMVLTVLWNTYLAHSNLGKIPLLPPPGYLLIEIRPICENYPELHPDLFTLINEIKKEQGNREVCLVELRHRRSSQFKKKFKKS